VHLSEEDQKAIANDPALNQLMKSVEQGASSTVWAATAAALEGQGGKYIEDCQFAKPVKAGSGAYGPGYGAHAYDEKREGLLWEKSQFKPNKLHRPMGHVSKDLSQPSPSAQLISPLSSSHHLSPTSVHSLDSPLYFPI
jgi:hypothetical protein